MASSTHVHLRETAAARLLSVNVGLPNDVAWHGETVHTAVWKRAVSGPRVLRRLNIDGNGQGDLIGHGGEQRAVLVYEIDSYRYWQRELGRDDFVCGQFGENFTVDGLPDAEVCIGDRYRIGGAVLEVTQPRVTCYRVGIRMNEPRMAALLVSHRRPGFYMRVIEEGEVEAGEAIIKVASGADRMSVAEANALLYLRELRRAEDSARCRFFPLWPNGIHACAPHRPRSVGRSRHAHPYRNIRLGGIPYAGHRRTGVCHSCESGLVAGAVAYQPDPLECPADGNLLICCSRPRSDVVIDL